MVRHVILWKLKEEHNTPEVKAAIKEHLESLVGVVPGLVSLSVHTEALPSSNADLCLDSVLVDEAALKGYATHPAHVAAADTFVCPFVETRLCLDFEV
ncbi:MAG: Dabb family protein [Clostridia bacterium]|nr:Dabb family protein [Clostridia bacterium]